MLFEKNKLIELELYELIHKIEHVSITKGDGLGYDIVSFDSTGKQIYIEVKTTTKKLESNFFFTRNEIAQMNRLKDAYCLYRVYDLDIENNTGQIEIFY